MEKRLKIYWYETGVLSTARIGNPNILAKKRDETLSAIEAENQAIASGKIKDPLLVVQEKYGNVPLTATGRKALQAAQASSVIRETTRAQQAAFLEIAYQAQNKQIESDIAQAEYRSKAGAVGATSEAAKQTEQRAVASSQGIAIGTIGKTQVSTAQNSVVTTVQQTKTPVGSALVPPKEVENIFRDEQEPADIQAINQFFNQYKSTTLPTRAIIEGYLKDKNVKLTPEGSRYIASIIEAGGGSMGSSRDQATYFDPQSNTFYNARTGEGDLELAKRLGFIATTNEKNQVPLIINGKPEIITFEEPNEDYRIFPAYGPQEKPQVQGPQRELPDPLRLREATQYLLDASEKISKESKAILESDAPIFNFFDTKNSKARAAIEQTLAEAAKDTLAVAGFMNLGGYVASLQKGTQPEEQIIVPPTKTGVLIEKLTETKGDIGKSLQQTEQEYTEQYGKVGSIAGSIIPLASLISLKPLSPIKFGKISLPIGETKTIISVSRAPIKPASGLVETKIPIDTVVYRGITVGVPFTRKVQPVIGRAGGRFQAGSPTPESLRLNQLKPVGDGFEIGGGNVLEQKVLLSQSTRDYLVSSGTLDKTQVDRLTTVIQGEKLAEKAPVKLFSDTFGDQPVVRLKAGPETELQKIIIAEQQRKRLGGRVGSIKGGLAQKPQLLRQFARATHDIDAPEVSVKAGRRFAAQTVEEQNIVAEFTKSGRAFQTAGEFKTKVEVGIRTGAVYPINPRLRLGVNEAVHGTSKRSARNILQTGVDTTASKRGRAFFIAKTSKLASGFASRATSNRGGTLLKIKYNKGDIVNWENIPKGIRQRIYNDNWLRFQNNAINYAKRLNKKGITKPYKTRDPLSQRKEVIIIDKSAIKSIEEIPLEFRPEIKNPEKVAEYLTPKDVAKYGSGSAKRNPRFVLGSKINQKNLKVEDIKIISLSKQRSNKASSVASIQLKKGKLVVEPVEHRVGTDVPDLYAIYKTQAVTIGGKKGRELDITAERLKELYPEVDFVKPFKGTTPPAEKSGFENVDSIYSSISSTVRDTGVRPVSLPTLRRRESKSQDKQEQATLKRINSSISSYNRIGSRRSSVISIGSRQSVGSPVKNIVESLSSFGGSKSRSVYSSIESNISFGSKPSRASRGSRSLSSIGSRSPASIPSRSPFSPASRLSISPISRQSLGPSPTRITRSPFSPASRGYGSFFGEGTPVTPATLRIAPIIIPRDEDRKKLLFMKRSDKYYTIYDVAKTPFGKIKYYVGKQQQSLKPIQELRGRAKNPIGQLAPSNIFNLKVGKLFKQTRSKKNNFGFYEIDLF